MKQAKTSRAFGKEIKSIHLNDLFHAIPYA